VFAQRLTSTSFSKEIKLATAHINEDETQSPKASSLARLRGISENFLSAISPELPHKSLQPFMEDVYK